MAGIPHILIDLADARPPYRDGPATAATQSSLPAPKTVKTHPSGKNARKENANIYFIGTATTSVLAFCIQEMLHLVTQVQCT